MAHLKHTTWQTQRGLTLVELMVTISVIAILATTAVSTMSNMRAKQQVIAAAEEILSKAQRAKSLARKKSEEVWLESLPDSLAVGDYGVTEINVTDSASNLIESIDLNSKHKNVEVKTNVTGRIIKFNHVRGTTGNAGSLFVTDDSSENNYVARIVVSSLGRLRICSESGLSGRYDDC